MELIKLTATTLTIDVKKNNIVYTTGIEAPKGVLLMADEDGSHDMTLANSVHSGGPVSLTMKPLRMPSKRYEVGETIGYLLVL